MSGLEWLERERLEPTEARAFSARKPAIRLDPVTHSTVDLELFDFNGAVDFLEPIGATWQCRLDAACDAV